MPISQAMVPDELNNLIRIKDFRSPAYSAKSPNNNYTAQFKRFTQGDQPSGQPGLPKDPAAASGRVDGAESGELGQCSG